MPRNDLDSRRTASPARARNSARRGAPRSRPDRISAGLLERLRHELVVVHERRHQAQFERQNGVVSLQHLFNYFFARGILNRIYFGVENVLARPLVRHWHVDDLPMVRYVALVVL